MRSHMISGMLPLLALIGCAPTPSEEGLDPERVMVKIDKPRFVFQTGPPTVSFTARMLELSPNHFLTVYAYWEDESPKRYYKAPKTPCPQGDQPGDCPWLGIRALFWHLENAPESESGA